MVKPPLKITTSNFNVEFTLSCSSNSSRHCVFRAHAYPKDGGQLPYAYFQVYEEWFGRGKKSEPFIDKECNQDKVPYCTSHKDAFKYGVMTDIPKDNHACPWELHMYTLFCEVDTSGSDEDPLKWKYIKGAGVEWGFKRGSPTKVSCFGLEIMEKAEIEVKFRVIKDKFPGLKF